MSSWHMDRRYPVTDDGVKCTECDIIVCPMVYDGEDVTMDTVFMTITNHEEVQHNGPQGLPTLQG